MRSYEKSSSWFAEGMQKLTDRWKKVYRYRWAVFWNKRMFEILNVISKFGYFPRHSGAGYKARECTVMKIKFSLSCALLSLNINAIESVI